MKCKNTIAMVLAGAMLLPSNAFAADLSQYRDFPNDWSAKSLEQAIDDGLLKGRKGRSCKVRCRRKGNYAYPLRFPRGFRTERQGSRWHELCGRQN